MHTSVLADLCSQNTAFLGLERLCACTSDGELHFYITTDEEDSVEDKEDLEDVTMMTTEQSYNKNTIPSTSTSSCPQ